MLNSQYTRLQLIGQTLILLLVCATVSAQIPEGEEFTFSTTNKEVRWSFWAHTFEWDNGPFGEENYQDHTFGIGFNVDKSGNKIVQNKVSFTWTLGESQYRNGNAGEPGAFMSEHFFSWCSPYNTICIRPVGFTVQYDTGNVRYDYHGSFAFFRNASNGGGQWGALYDNGMFDMSMGDGGMVVFKNNTPGLLWRTADGQNSVNPIRLNEFNQTVIGGGGADTIVNSTNLRYKGSLYRGDVKILGAQCAAIADPLVGEKLNNVTVIAILQCLRSHGLLAH